MQLISLPYRPRALLNRLMAFALALLTIVAPVDVANAASAHKASNSKVSKTSHCPPHSAKHCQSATRKATKKKTARHSKRHVSRMSAKERARLAALPHRLGPTEIFQDPDAQASLNLGSRAAVIINAETGDVLYSKNPNRTMPIASITKLMTSMVVLDAHQPMDEMITITEDDVDTLRHTTSRLAVGATLPRREVMLLALMASENRAAAALARTYPGGTRAAIAAMNAKARELGMRHTRFLDATGLHSENSASPNDLVLMVKAARAYPNIHKATTTVEYVADINDRPVTFHNTNALVKNDTWNIEVSKTGFINEAGRCLVMQARIKSTPVIIVLMDSVGRYTRIGDANRVRKWLESAIDLTSLSADGNRPNV